MLNKHVPENLSTEQPYRVSIKKAHPVSQMSLICLAMLSQLIKLYSDLSLPQLRDWSWHLLTSEWPVRVAKASSGQFPLPFLISI